VTDGGKLSSTSASKQRILGDESELNDGKLDSLDCVHLGSESPLAQPSKLHCPECGSEKLWKDGLRYIGANEEPVQRFLCRSCGYRFSQPSKQLNVVSQVLHSRSDLAKSTISDRDFSFKKPLNNFAFSLRKDVASHTATVVGKRLNSLRSYSSNCQVCVSEAEGSKNLVINETQQTSQQTAGAATTTPDKATVKGKLIEFVFWLQKQGYDEVTRKKRFYKLQRLGQLGANLWNPENVKEVLGKQSSWRDSYKRQIVYAYENFMMMEQLTWKRPMYKKSDRQEPFIPTETELDKLISSCGKKVGTFLQGLKDTGCDPSELAAITWIDIDSQRKTVNINHPVKGHNPRILKVSREFLDRLESLPKTSERIFSLHTINGLFYRQRKNVTRKLVNPRIRKIALTTFRDWKLTMIAHRTRDPFQVMAISGHKSMQSIMFYINVAKVLFGSGEYDEYTVRVANNVGEATALTEAGFEYVTGEYNDGGKIFKKLKVGDDREYVSTPQNNVEGAGSSVV